MRALSQKLTLIMSSCETDLVGNCPPNVRFGCSLMIETDTQSNSIESNREKVIREHPFMASVNKGRGRRVRLFCHAIHGV